MNSEHDNSTFNFTAAQIAAMSRAELEEAESEFDVVQFRTEVLKIYERSLREGLGSAADVAYKAEKVRMLRNLGSLFGTGPVVGTPCSVLVGSDSRAAKVTKVSKTGAKVWVRCDERDDRVFTLRKRRGVYAAVGRNTVWLRFFEARDYRDLTFWPWSWR